MNVQPVSLRPLGVGEILDKAFRLYRANFWFFIGIAGILYIPFLGLEILSQVVFHDAQWITLIEGVVTANLLPGALAWVASAVYLGHSTSLNEAYGVARRRFWSFIKANLLQGVAYIPAGFALVIGAMLQTVGLVAGWLLAIPYIAYFSARWGVVNAAIVLETLGGSPALDRSWALTAKDFKHVLGAVVMAELLVYLVAALPGLAINYAVSLSGSMQEIGPLLAMAVTKMGSLLSTPFSIISVVILYYDLRVRREGYDLELALHEDDEEVGIGTEIEQA